MQKFSLALTVSVAMLLGACFDSDRNINRQDDGGDDPVAGNQAPTISGSPLSNVLEGEAYEFVPSASDPDGDSLEFAISRKPAWATFDKTTGRLSGTPDGEDVGNFTNVQISVSDGKASAALPDFSISVNQIAAGSATLSWTPPTENADGSLLADLAGYRIYYGRSANMLDRSIALGNPGLTRYVVENLPPANWHFAMTSVNTNGIESARSPTVSKTIT